jgi:hypothetical protein
MGSLEAMAKGSEARYLSDTQNLKIAQVRTQHLCPPSLLLPLPPCSYHHTLFKSWHPWLRWMKIDMYRSR